MLDINDQVTEFGDILYQRHAAHLEQRYFGQYVIFNLENENFVVGPSHLEAIKTYRAKHGHARGWCRGIGFLSRV